MAQMYMARSTKAPHAPEMKIRSARRTTFRHIAEEDLDVALRELSSGTVPGDDEIHCEELRHRGKAAMKCVLRLFGCSWPTGQVPAKWRHGIIVSLLKQNKPASSMASFLPVTLTSTLCKLMERIAARRVRDCIEAKLQSQQFGEGRAQRRRRLRSLTIRVLSIQLIAAALSRSFCLLVLRHIWWRGSRVVCKGTRPR
ncbi:hypothetical protein TRVL_08923 [Trypanosoma vivax]|nr:hypothetical protein TRVL_08923 [Trypanosoma vivax]